MACVLRFTVDVDCWIGVVDETDRRLVRLAGRLSVAQVPELLGACANATAIHLDLTGSPALDGYGAGLRVQVPFVDLLRLDVAWGEPGRGATAYFGVSLKATRQRQRVR